MSPRLIAYVLVALGALVVVLTRIRMRREGAAGAHQVPRGVVLGHTVFGVLGLVSWLAYLRTHGQDTTLGVDRELVGIVALACLWILSVLGLMILLRWLPSRGRHASAATEDNWSDGPGLSVLAHVGMFLAVAFFTVSYMLNTL